MTAVASISIRMTIRHGRFRQSSCHSERTLEVAVLCTLNQGKGGRSMSQVKVSDDGIRRKQKRSNDRCFCSTIGKIIFL